MHYTIHHCQAPHIATEVLNKLPIAPSLYSAADDAYMTYNPTDYAVAAYHEGRIIGVFKYRVREGRGLKGKQLRACGTAVSKKFRKHGIAKALWSAALRKVQPTSVNVMVISDGGYNLVQALKQDFKGARIRFDLQDDRECV